MPRPPRAAISVADSTRPTTRWVSPVARNLAASSRRPELLAMRQSRPSASVAANASIAPGTMTASRLIATTRCSTTRNTQSVGSERPRNSSINGGISSVRIPRNRRCASAARDRPSECGQFLRHHPIGHRFAVDQHAVTVEDDQAQAFPPGSHHRMGLRTHAGIGNIIGQPRRSDGQIRLPAWLHMPGPKFLARRTRSASASMNAGSEFCAGTRQ